MLRGLVKKYNKQHKPEEAPPNITMTLNYYAHATFASAKAEMDRLVA